MHGELARRPCPLPGPLVEHGEDPGGHPQGHLGFLAGRKVNVWDGDNYAWEITGVLGIRDKGSGVRAGLVHYNDRSDVDRLLASVAELAS